MNSVPANRTVSRRRLLNGEVKRGIVAFLAGRRLDVDTERIFGDGDGVTKPMGRKAERARRTPDH